MKPTRDDLFFTTREAADRLGISLRTAQLWSENGLLEAWKTDDGHRRISVESVQRILEKEHPLALKWQDEFGRLKVLVVEDDDLLLKAYKVRLNSWGLPIEIITVPNAYEALVLIGRESPDLMIADLMMPGIDGFQMIKTLTNSPFKEGMEMVVVSGLSPQEIDAHGGLPLGIPVYPKPIPFDTLKEYCQNLLDRRRGEMEMGRSMGAPVADHLFQVRDERNLSKMRCGKPIADSEYIFGISEIDSQHEEIEENMIALLEAIDSKNSWHVIQVNLESLYDKLTVHFTLEEAVMHMFSLPETQKHTRSHREILESLANCINKTPCSLEVEDPVKQTIPLVFEEIHTHDLKFIMSINLLRNQLLNDKKTALS
ncbi:MAG: response regulator [Betaproteobacteria bacterium]